MHRFKDLDSAAISNEKHGENLKSQFLKMLNESPEKAVTLLNSKALRFSTLYMMLPEIAASGVFDKLNPKNQTAVLLCAVIDPELELPAGVQRELPKSELCHSALKWVLLSGYKDNGLSGEFDKALDTAACCLIRIYHDSSVLPVIVDLIFKRNRKGQYVGDLVWALFSCKDPKILKLITQYLISSNKQDKELADKLLKNEDVSAFKADSRSGRYAACNSWLKENGPYLYFTDETFQQSCDPTLFRVNLEAKYLCKKASRPQKVMQTFSQYYYDRIEAFRRMSEEQQTILARYSNHLYSLDKRQWNRWMSYPIKKQIEIAAKAGV